MKHLAAGFIYIWRDKKRRKYCIGSHLGPENDGYITSTGYMKTAYLKRPTDFRRKIIEYVYEPNLTILHIREQYWLNMIKNDELGKKYYNYKKHASGGNGSANKGNPNCGGWQRGLTKEMLEKRKHKEFYLFIDKSKEKRKPTYSAERRKKLSDQKKLYWENYRNSHSKKPKEQKRSRSEAAKQYFQNHPEKKKELSLKLKGKTAWNKGLPNPISAESGRKGARKLSETVAGRKLVTKDNGERYWVYPEKQTP